MKRLKPLNDYIFQKLMGEKGDEEQLLSFLNAVLKRTGPDRLQSVEILENKTFTPEIIGNKTVILDVRAIANCSEKFNIEIQFKDLHNMGKRDLVYWSREYLKDLAAGDDYSTLPKVITITIVNFDYIPLDSYHTCFHLREDTASSFILTDVLEIHFINMAKFRLFDKKDILNDPLDRWLSFLDETTAEDILQEIITMDATIRKTNKKLQFLSRDKETLQLYHLREMGMSDYTTAINTAIARGYSNRGDEWYSKRGSKEYTKPVGLWYEPPAGVCCS
ncbi:Rpn family recombination-promoting nuclease/putative transposase [Breznakiellaceae bacterium SP9]